MSAARQYAIVGLGNPGKRYEHTRHNIGADALCLFASKNGAPDPSSWRTKNDTLYTKFERNGCELYLILPQTFMNLSGEGVQPLLAYFKLSVSDLIVLYDELDLSAGTVRIRRGGSAGGHNGVSSIIERLGSPDFFRIRIGISRPQVPSGADKGEIVSSWVLSRPRPDEQPIYRQGVETACSALEAILDDGPVAAQNRFNQRPAQTAEPGPK